MHQKNWLDLQFGYCIFIKVISFFFFTFLRQSKIFNLIFLDFNQRIWLVGAANSHSNMKDQFLYLCQFLLLGYKLFKSHPFKKKKNSQPCLPLRSLMHFFFSFDSYYFSALLVSLLIHLLFTSQFPQIWFSCPPCS